MDVVDMLRKYPLDNTKVLGTKVFERGDGPACERSEESSFVDVVEDVAIEEAAAGLLETLAEFISMPSLER
eukprot:CAMPEP_0177753362 /NCGR_PEP_ID=MMETSP0491_2-20121128/1419_1 /TAXON_ID=63592 /ORGANISM="Tetraselmis chuii, Strain PLY429" /LENGTH=70 /DNA_ID=CAMNT_0019268641 /DNA_START=180 /DNA_END=391 /DNA_ORIENTATION=+